MTINWISDVFGRPVAHNIAAAWVIPKQPEDTRFELLWKRHFSHVQQRGKKSIFKLFGYIPKQLEDTRFELLWKRHFSHMQQRGKKSIFKLFGYKQLVNVYLCVNNHQ